jgi:hypothetical protein
MRRCGEPTNKGIDGWGALVEPYASGANRGLWAVSTSSQRSRTHVAAGNRNFREGTEFQSVPPPRITEKHTRPSTVLTLVGVLR